MSEEERHMFLFPCPECKLMVGGWGTIDDDGNVDMEEHVTCDCGWSSENLEPEKKPEEEN